MSSMPLREFRIPSRTARAASTLATLGMIVGSAVLMLLTPTPATSQPAFRVIVHPDNPVASMSATEVSRLFLKKVTTWPGGQKALPVDQLENAAVRTVFSEQVHGREVEAVKAYWNKIIFSGRGVPPTTLDGDRAVIEYVLANPEAIGYVSARADVSGVRVLNLR